MTGRDGPGAGVLDGNATATVSDLGLTRKPIHEARQLRDGEAADPGVIRRALDAQRQMGRSPQYLVRNSTTSLRFATYYRRETLMKNLAVAIIATVALTGTAFAQGNASTSGQSGHGASSGSSMQQGNTTGSTTKQGDALKNGNGTSGNAAGDLSKNGTGSGSASGGSHK
ncbi:hypothetical protein [Methylobacterium longum]|uniref:Uncharacterized protein n=1 Tax=Methylobacterium longum TaxID=767694 RepID=A0ABT8AQ07_9HYPH|nr:hypothetical protein [Methylobacterium longum]MDN3571894.1 hypothetical protein [Methylobacterium longum]